MKKLLFRILLIVALSILLLTAVFAEGNTYQIPEMGLEITIPSGFFVITKDTPDSDPAFSAAGQTKTELIAYFETSGIYLNAFPSDSYEELVVTMSEGVMEDFNLLSDSVLEIVASSFDDLYAEQNVEVTSCSLYQHSQAKFVKLYFYDTVNTVWGVQYFTTYNAQAMNFTLRSYEGEITAEQEAFVKTVVDSIRFDADPILPEVGEETSSFRYEDTESGLQFIVPANWVETELTEKRETIDVAFTATQEDGYCIYYGSMDVWKELSDIEKFGYTRKDYNNSVVSESDIAEAYGVTVDEVSFTKYNGITYYLLEVPFEGDLLGLPVTVKMTHLVHISNGWMYLFQFAGSVDSEFYSDFEYLMKSVEYHDPDKPKTSAPFRYTDQTSGVIFTVPANWKQGDPVDVEDVSGFDFYSADHPEHYITYWSSDLWTQQTEQEKEENPRSVINNSDVTHNDIAEMYELTSADVSEVTYNGVEYFKVVTDAETEPVTQLVRFDNGWMYEFEFVGTDEDAAYADFEKILGSVKYPVVTEMASEKPIKIEKPQTKTEKGSYAMIVVALAILASVGIAVLVVGIIMENRKRQEEREPGTAFVCKACGHMLPADSLFCQYCGTKIRKKDRSL